MRRRRRREMNRRNDTLYFLVRVGVAVTERIQISSVWVNKQQANKKERNKEKREREICANERSIMSLCSSFAESSAIRNTDI